MDFKVSRKERRIYKDGPVEVLMDNAIDLFPIFGTDPRFADEEIYIGQEKVTGLDRDNIIMDVEILDDGRDELLDRAMSAVMWQRGADPVEPDHGIQWAEAIIGEVPATTIMQQVDKTVREEGPGVQITPFIVKNGNKENLAFKISLTNSL
jgi:hypothetical protein